MEYFVDEWLGGALSPYKRIHAQADKRYVDQNAAAAYNVLERLWVQYPRLHGFEQEHRPWKWPELEKNPEPEAKAKAKVKGKGKGKKKRPEINEELEEEEETLQDSD